MTKKRTGNPFNSTHRRFVPAKTRPVAISRSRKSVTSVAKARGTFAALPNEPSTLAHMTTYKPVSVGPKTPTDHAGKKAPKPKMAAANRLSTLSLKRPKGPPAKEATTLMAMPNSEFISAIRLPQIRPASTEIINVSATAHAACCNPAAKMAIANWGFLRNNENESVHGAQQVATLSLHRARSPASLSLSSVLCSWETAAIATRRGRGRVAPKAAGRSVAA
mmetsp:Transcript_68017/g.208467  ORF Transcript_68017/g.208467 Transcript_68017/m.208467 type:complete len:221 (-) Transcript_68017:10-672(-)